MLSSVLTLLALLASQGDTRPAHVNSVCDLSQEFTFYIDGRFHRQYLEGAGRDARNWGSLARLELDNVNLLVLVGGDPRVPYSDASIEHVDGYVRAGGTVLLMLDGGEPMPPAAALAERWGAHPLLQPAEGPLRPAHERLPADATIEARPGTVLELGRGWEALVHDAGQRPVLAFRARGKGWVLVGSRGLFGQRPDASDPINASWVRPLLISFAGTKEVDPALPHAATWAEHERAIGALVLEFTDGTAPFADAIAAEYERVRPHLVALTGVEPSEGMIKRLLILPTGGGGFSSGARIAIGAFWGGYPERTYPMVELIGHEAGHSWVLPHPEPLWNEPIATYLGIQVGRRLGMPEAEETLARQLAKGRALDPEFRALDPLEEGAARDLVWGKSFFVFEELERLHGPGALARYFRTKRTVLAPGREAYTMDDCVAVWSRALGEDLFGWFRGLAFSVDAARTDLWPL